MTTLQQPHWLECPASNDWTYLCFRVRFGLARPRDCTCDVANAVAVVADELMHGVGCISDITVRAAADHCPRLRQFNISGRHTPSMAGLTYLCERARGLTHVAVVSCPSLASLALDGGSCLRGSLTVLTEVTPELQAQTGLYVGVA